MEGGAGCPVGYKKSSSKKRGHACVKCTKRSASGKCVGKRVYSGTKGSAKKRSTRKRSTRKRSIKRCAAGSLRGSDGKCHAYPRVIRRPRGYQTPAGYVKMAYAGSGSPARRSLTMEEVKAKYYTPSGMNRKMTPGGKNLYF